MIHGAIGDFTQAYAKRPARRTRSKSCSRSAASTSRRWRSFRKRAPSGGRAIERIARWFADWETKTARPGGSRAGGDPRRDRNSARWPQLSSVGARRPYRAARRRRLRDPGLQDRTGAHHAAGGEPDFRRSSRSKAPSCGPAGSPIFRAALRSPLWSTCRSGAAIRAARKSRSSSRIRRRTRRPTARYRSSPRWRAGSRIRPRPTGRASGRCSRAAPMGTTIIWRG